MAADYILTSGTDREHRGRAGSGIDFQNSRLRSAGCSVTTLNEYPARKRSLRRGVVVKVALMLPAGIVTL